MQSDESIFYGSWVFFLVILLWNYSCTKHLLGWRCYFSPRDIAINKQKRKKFWYSGDLFYILGAQTICKLQQVRGVTAFCSHHEMRCDAMRCNDAMRCDVPRQELNPYVYQSACGEAGLLNVLLRCSSKNPLDDGSEGWWDRMLGDGQCNG